MVFFLSDQTGSFDKSLKPERGEREFVWESELVWRENREWMEFRRVRNRSEPFKDM